MRTYGPGEGERKLNWIDERPKDLRDSEAVSSEHRSGGWSEGTCRRRSEVLVDGSGSGLEVTEADPEQGPALGLKQRRVTGIERSWRRRRTGTAIAVRVESFVVEVGRQEDLEGTGTGNLQTQRSLNFSIRIPLRGAYYSALKNVWLRYIILHYILTFQIDYREWLHQTPQNTAVVTSYCITLH